MKRFLIALIGVGIIGFGAWFGYATFAQDSCKEYRINSWEGCKPIVETVGVISTDKYSAIVQAFYSSNNADYNKVDEPKLGIEFDQYGTFNLSSEFIPQPLGSQKQSFLLNGLKDGKTYYYRAVLYWAGGVEYGATKEFTVGKQTIGTGVSPATSSTTGNTTNTTTNTTTDDFVISTAPTISPWGNLFGGNKKTTPTTTSRFKQVEEKSGFKLAIDNGETQVRQGDTITTKVRYENNNTKSYENGTVEIYLPKEYSFESTNKGVHDRVDNVVVINLREFPAGGFGTVIVTARATGKTGNIDQVVSQASMKIGTTTLKVSDVDEYQEGNLRGNSGLGGSVAGTGFLPGSLIGWIILLIVLALIVVIGRRYFIKKDY